MKCSAFKYHSTTWFRTRRQQQQEDEWMLSFESFWRVKFLQRNTGESTYFFPYLWHFCFWVSWLWKIVLFVFFIWNWDVSGFLCYWDISLLTFTWLRCLCFVYSLCLIEISFQKISTLSKLLQYMKIGDLRQTIWLWLVWCLWWFKFEIVSFFGVTEGVLLEGCS